TPVASLADVARSYLESEDSLASRSAVEALDVLSLRAKGLTRFVEAYRAMARLPEPALRPVDIGSLLRDIVRVFEQSTVARDVSLTIDLAPDVPALDLDETLMTQALLNVLTNAAEATGGNGGERRIKVSLACVREEVHVLIADNGCGVPENLSGQIFHAFVTTKANGTGTGLNLARQIALAHGGDLILVGHDATWSAIFCFVLRSPTGPAAALL
ncbi:MAG: sensor histidine kinase, partial [Asticcacaulis sp.]|nr:sensor histidine kinase [Asticcacaulis sp.]